MAAYTNGEVVDLVNELLERLQGRRLNEAIVALQSEINTATAPYRRDSVVGETSGESSQEDRTRDDGAEPVTQEADSSLPATTQPATGDGGAVGNTADTIMNEAGQNNSSQTGHALPDPPEPGTSDQNVGGSSPEKGPLVKSGGAGESKAGAQKSKAGKADRDVSKQKDERDDGQQKTAAKSKAAVQNSGDSAKGKTTKKPAAKASAGEQAGKHSSVRSGRVEKTSSPKKKPVQGKAASQQDAVSAAIEGIKSLSLVGAGRGRRRALIRNALFQESVANKGISEDLANTVATWFRRLYPGINPTSQTSYEDILTSTATTLHRAGATPPNALLMFNFVSHVFSVQAIVDMYAIKLDLVTERQALQQLLASVDPSGNPTAVAAGAINMRIPIYLVLIRSLHQANDISHEARRRDFARMYAYMYTYVSYVNFVNELRDPSGEAAQEVLARANLWRQTVRGHNRPARTVAEDAYVLLLIDIYGTTDENGKVRTPRDFTNCERVLKAKLLQGECLSAIASWSPAIHLLIATFAWPRTFQRLTSGLLALVIRNILELEPNMHTLFGHVQRLLYDPILYNQEPGARLAFETHLDEDRPAALSSSTLEELFQREVISLTDGTMPAVGGGAGTELELEDCFEPLPTDSTPQQPSTQDPFLEPALTYPTPQSTRSIREFTEFDNPEDIMDED